MFPRSALLITNDVFCAVRTDVISWKRSYAELVPKFHVALHASHEALPMVTLKISHYTNATLTVDFDFRLGHLVHGRYG
jgi:hypothetical protein